MTSDENIIDMDKLTNAVSNKLADNVSVMMKLSMESFEKSLQQLTRSSIESINQSIKSEMGNFKMTMKLGLNTELNLWRSN